MEALQKIVPGELYDANYDPKILEIRKEAKTKIHEFNQLSPAEDEKREAIIRELFGSVGKNPVIEAPFYCDYGANIHLGDDVAINHNMVILDGAEVRIGNCVFIAPNVGLHTAGHPIDVERRSKGLEFASPITIEDYVWIGASVTVIPGVTIGKGSVIAAGSVVIRDIPEGVVAAGNPCRVIRKITAEDQKTTNFIKRK
ncbi:LAQU0S03e01640g1_1 [Lachancea quebecensis]|uniref:Acetyltransferase n=1 Tax=Lachancea quebecensis TaxID=1654605 RepID=A0A0N7ML62_9SACH|nr:LAQU0S03e01640g1_1 [Lachancea quebecensis]